VPLPEPRPGLVIRYAYLWRSEHERGREEGTKDRPCAVVLATTRDGEATRVVVAAITHAPPRDTIDAIEVPAAVKARLGLDHERSWIVTSEVNVFTWPGPDLRLVDPRDRDRGIAYGFLPSALAKTLIARVLEQVRLGRTGVIGRDDKP
jgi:hypothetical protein